MANLNKVSLIGRLTRDPESKTFSNGGKVCNIGFAVNNRKKNQQSGQWEDVPVWLDLKAFNRETGRKLADLAEQYLKKGQQVYVEGHLVLEEWTSKDDSAKKNSKLVIYVDDFQFLDKKEGGAPSAAGSSSYGARATAQAPAGGGDDIEEVPF
jgi:single-strand DNA-binding protein